MSKDGNVNGMPPWVKAIGYLAGTIGLPGVIALYLLGAMPGLPNPIAKLSTDLSSHIHQDEERTRLLRLLCRGVWRGQPEVQERCGD